MIWLILIVGLIIIGNLGIRGYTVNGSKYRRSAFPQIAKLSRHPVDRLNMICVGMDLQSFIFTAGTWGTTVGSFWRISSRGDIGC